MIKIHGFGAGMRKWWKLLRRKILRYGDFILEKIGYKD